MRKIGYDSWGALVVVVAVLAVTLIADFAPAPPTALIGVSASGPVGLVAAIEEMPGSETVWNIAAILFSAVIAAGAAILAARWSAKSTMANARELQDRERRKDEVSCAAILAADLHMKLTDILTCLGEPIDTQVGNLATVVDPGRKVLDAVLPKLGDLGQDGAANLLNAYRGVTFLVADSKRLLMNLEEANFAAQHDFLLKNTREVARILGAVIYKLWHKYNLARPSHRYEEAGINLEALELKELKDRGF